MLKRDIQYKLQNDGKTNFFMEGKNIMSESLPKTDPRDINWSSLGFAYMPTNSHVRATWQDGKWSAPVLLKEPTITMSIAATCLHY